MLGGGSSSLSCLSPVEVLVTIQDSRDNLAIYASRPFCEERLPDLLCGTSLIPSWATCHAPRMSFDTRFKVILARPSRFAPDEQPGNKDLRGASQGTSCRLGLSVLRTLLTCLIPLQLLLRYPGTCYHCQSWLRHKKGIRLNLSRPPVLLAQRMAVPVLAALLPLETTHHVRHSSSSFLPVACFEYGVPFRLSTFSL